ncbi:MAG: SRPBCC domain-containing protein [Thermoleophilia bacterium]|nr:SRPBCC domain-containing protein [Thermoleophilia bacterium]
MNQVSEDTDTDAVRIVREMAAPAKDVYDAFLNPDQLMRWMGPKRFKATDVEIVPEVGGSARITVEAENGDRGSFDWKFVELVPDEKIVISFAFGGPNGETDTHRSRFTVSLVENAPDRTELTLVHDRLGQAPPGGHAGVNQGWTEATAKLAQMFEADKGTHESDD